jgi:hypothetical protein
MHEVRGGGKVGKGVVGQDVTTKKQMRLSSDLPENPLVIFKQSYRPKRKIK